VIVRGAIGQAFLPTRFALLFWLETFLLVLPSVLLLSQARRENIDLLFKWSIPVALGGMFYRFDPTTLAYTPVAGAYYFPSMIEILIALGWVSLAVMMFLVMVKRTAILPAPIENWYKLEQYHKALNTEVKLTGYVESHSH